MQLTHSEHAMITQTEQAESVLGGRGCQFGCSFSACAWIVLGMDG